jgi:hypothetical protein
MNYETKDDLAGAKLLHYSRTKPKHFLQLDGFYCPDDGDNNVIDPDIDGDRMCAGGTVELMRGADVRILIPHDVDISVAVRQIKKLAKWLKSSPDLLEMAQPGAGDEFGHVTTKRTRE